MANAEPQERRERARFSAPTIADRLPPHAPEAEQGVLACVLLSPDDSMSVCIDRLHGKEAFYDLRHQEIYDVFVEMFDNREPIDSITLIGRLKAKGVLDRIGGMAYISALPDAVPSAGNLPTYLDIVVERHELRQMIALCTQAVGRAYDESSNYRKVLEETERGLLQLLSGSPESQIPIKEAVKRSLSKLEALHAGKGAVSGLATGFPDLDRLTCGLHGSEVFIIAARPSMGKTSLAMNIAEYVAVGNSIPVGVFSMEMSTESLVMRMLSSRARLDHQKVRSGYFTMGDFDKMFEAAKAIAKAPLFIDDSPNLTVLQLRSKARRMVQLYGIKLFVVDYLQLMRGSAKRVENRQQEVTEISQGLKAMSKELDVPVIVLSQLNREIERGQRKPRLSDLRESGSIEQDADTVGMLYRPDEENEGAVNLLIPKQRNGPTGDINLVFLKQCTRFESAAKVASEDVPA